MSLHGLSYVRRDGSSFREFAGESIIEPQERKRPKWLTLMRKAKRCGLPELTSCACELQTTSG
jgi:hypothetical protein